MLQPREPGAQRFGIRHVAQDDPKKRRFRRCQDHRLLIGLIRQFTKAFQFKPPLATVGKGDDQHGWCHSLINRDGALMRRRTFPVEDFDQGLVARTRASDTDNGHIAAPRSKASAKPSASALAVTSRCRIKASAVAPVSVVRVARCVQSGIRTKAWRSAAQSTKIVK